MIKLEPKATWKTSINKGRVYIPIKVRNSLKLKVNDVIEITISKTIEVEE